MIPVLDRYEVAIHQVAILEWFCKCSYGVLIVHIRIASLGFHLLVRADDVLAFLTHVCVVCCQVLTKIDVLNIIFDNNVVTAWTFTYRQS